MKITILPQGTMAIYEQIVNQLKNEIVTGELTPGEALPSIRMLAADLSVSMAAYSGFKEEDYDEVFIVLDKMDKIGLDGVAEELEKEGLIRSVAGKGFYVCESNKDYLKEKQLMMLEKRLAELISDARQAGMSCRDFVDMATVLYEGK